MNQAASSTTLASVIFLKIQEFTRKPVAAQARLRSQLEAIVAVSTAALPSEERIILDTSSGTAIVVLGNPKGALEVAERSLEASAGLPLCIGVNHGPIKVASGEGGEQVLEGDGIASADTVAEFATPSRLLVSRSFRDALAEAAPHLEASLRPAGTFTDSRVRAHELLTPIKEVGVSRRRRFFAMSVLSVVGFLGTGAVVRDAVKRKTKSGPPGILRFDISPHGEIFIDGDAKGKSPPVTQLRVSPGRHTIEVRNGSHPPLTLDVDLESGEQMTITHSFSSGTPGEIIRGLRKKLGL